MHRLELSLPDPAKNLALDEALLRQAELDPQRPEYLRLWQFSRYTVILGRGSCIEQEVNVARCRTDDIPVVRRSSGGATVVGGPGCLMYSLILNRERRPQLHTVSAIHDYVLAKIVAGSERASVSLQAAGTSDLCLDAGPGNAVRKVSGNSLRIRPDYILYHGTFLYDFRLNLLAELLNMPPRMPDYRRERDHRHFVVNLPAGRATLREMLVQTWKASEIVTNWPMDATQRLAREKYATRQWTWGR
ncbi:MAG: lipoate--protein ligase family protein [Planctomycetales bacterium]|nr:lipoate--protein ligase family protein [Planctomycetales bacterium]